MGPKTTAALVQVGVYIAMTSIGIGGVMLWKHNIKKGVRKDVTIEQQDDIITKQEILGTNAQEDRVAVEDESRESNNREQIANERLIKSQAAALSALEKENAILKDYADANNDCLRKPWPDGLRITGGDPIRATGKNDSINPK